MTMNLELPLGDPAPRPLRLPQEPIVRAADVEGPYRWSMSRAWGVGPTIMWTLFNPSNTNDRRDDPSTSRMMGFSYRWGFGSMIVTNAYPFIASRPSELHAWRRTFDHKAYEANGMRPWEMDHSSWSAFHHNQGIVSGLLTPEMTCVAVWGHGPTPGDLDHFLMGIGFRAALTDDDFDGLGITRIQPTWHCIGTNLDGSPVHPLARGAHRISDDATLREWKRYG